VLTLIFLPALYVAWFRISPPPSDSPIERNANLCGRENSSFAIFHVKLREKNAIRVGCRLNGSCRLQIM
jgi:hypothetical protein